MKTLLSGLTFCSEHTVLSAIPLFRFNAWWNWNNKLIKYGKYLIYSKPKKIQQRIKIYSNPVSMENDITLVQLYLNGLLNRSYEAKITLSFNPESLIELVKMPWEAAKWGHQLIRYLTKIVSCSWWLCRHTNNKSSRQASWSQTHQKFIWFKNPTQYTEQSNPVYIRKSWSQTHQPERVHRTIQSNIHQAQHYPDSAKSKDLSGKWRETKDLVSLMTQDVEIIFIQANQAKQLSHNSEQCMENYKYLPTHWY